MCGIMGYIGEKNATEIIVDGLRKLEYRGYDSAGVAIREDCGVFRVKKKSGELSNLESALAKDPIYGKLGVGHIRWATHGEPTDDNAHPHRDCTGKIVVVHNGIIENYKHLKAELQSKGHEFSSMTDTEVIAHLVEENYKGDIFEAVRVSLPQLHGAYAIMVSHVDEPDRIIVTRKAAPMVIGLGEHENYAASDATPLLKHTKKIVFLDNEQIGIINKEKVSLFDWAGKPLPLEYTTLNWNPEQAEKGGFPHYTLKEIYEQPTVIRNTLGGRLLDDEVVLDDIPDNFFDGVEHIEVIACGTSYYAGLVGKYLIEKIARTTVEVEYASEYRYANPIVSKNTLVIAISQSGETADTLEALREAKKLGAKTLGIINAKGSSLSREVDHTLYIHAGPEIGVASTKAFTATLSAFMMLSLYLAKKRGVNKDRVNQLITELHHVADKIEEILADTSAIELAAKKYAMARNFLFLGRGLNYPIALEGALKLKEISYIHAEGYASGEMKHGPIALIDAQMPVVAIATKSDYLDKVVSNISEVIARQGPVLAIGNKGNEELGNIATDVIYVPEVSEELSPIVNVIPMQLLAYYVSKVLRREIDKPRNLAKSVTVE